MRRPVRWISAALALATIAACGDDDRAIDAGMPDGGGDAASDGASGDAWMPAAPAPPAATPMPPALPSITPCPAGWIERTEGEVAYCEPWAEDVSATCAIGEAQRPGEAGCVAIGSACAAGDWPDDLPAGGAIVYVRAGASGGDGSVGAPFGTLAEALAAAPAGATVALAPGTYEGGVSLTRRDVVLRGACPARTRITSPTATVPMIRTGAMGIVIRDLTLGPCGSSAVSLSAAAGVEVRGVVVDGASANALLLEGGRLTLADVAIEDPRPSAAGDPGRAIQLGAGADVVLERVSIRGGDDAAIVAYGAGTSLRVTDSAVRDTSGRAGDGALGRGIHLMLGATGDIVRSALHRHRSAAVMAMNAGTTARIEQSSIRGVERDAADGLGGAAAQAHDGALIELRRCVVDGSSGTAILAGSGGAALTTEDTLVREVALERADGTAFALYGDATGEARRVAIARSNGALAIFGAGSAFVLEDATFDGVGGPDSSAVAVLDSGALTAERVAMRDTIGGGVWVDGAATRVLLRDLSIQRTRSTGEWLGRGIDVWEAHAEVRVATIEDVAEAGVLASDGASLVLEDATITGTRLTPDGRGGRGIGVQNGATAQIDRVVVTASHDMGVFVSEPGTVVGARDLVVRDTQPERDGYLGRGINVQYGAALTLERGLVAHNHEIGLCALGGTSVTLADVQVDGTLARACAVDGACDPAGTGLGSYDHAIVRAERTIVSASSLCGVHVARDAQLDLTTSIVRDNGVGACVQVPGYDIARLMNDVQYVDNDVTLDTRDQPIPDPALPDPEL